MNYAGANGAGATGYASHNTSSPCSKTKKHLCDVTDKISSFSMECTSRLNRCATLICSRSTPPEQERPRTPSADVSHGPGPSPGSSGSCGDDSQPPAKNCYRLVMLGSARVGKTSLVTRFLGGKFEESYTPTIEDFHRKLYRIRSEVHQLDLLDTSGNHPFPAMRRLSFLTGDLFVLVFSMDSRESFEEVIRLREQILETKYSATASGSRSKKNLPKVPMVIAGNKCDKDMKTVTAEEAQAYCATQDEACVFVDTSAKKNHRVDDLFYELFLVANLPLEMAPNHHKREKLLSKLDESELEPPTSQEDECVICINARATMQTSPCGHRVVCRRCFVKTIQSAVAQRLLPLRCVICRTRISRLTSSSGTWRLQGSASSYSMGSKSWNVPGSASSYSVNAARVTQSASLYSMDSGSSCTSGVSNMSNMSNMSNLSNTSNASGLSSSSSNSGVHHSHTHNSSCSTNGCLGAIPRNPSYYYKKSGQYSFKHRASDMPNRLPPIKEFPVNSPVKRTTSPVVNPGARFKSYTASSIKSASSLEKTPLLDDYTNIKSIKSTPVSLPGPSRASIGPSKIGLNAKIAPSYSKSPINRTNMATGKPITTPIISAATSRVISATVHNSHNSYSKNDEKYDNKKNETLERKKKEEKAKLKAEKEAKKEEKRLAKEEEKLAKQLAKEEKKRGKKDAKEREALLSADQRSK